MKLLYKIMIFLAIFQLMPLTVNALNIFPEPTFYSDREVGYNVNVSMTDPAYVWFVAGDIFSKLFIPNTNTHIETASIGAILTFIVGAGAVSAIFTRNFLIIPVVIQGWMIVAMLSRSMGFIGKLFYTWDNTALIYLFIIFGVCIVIIVIITMLESVTHGDV